MNLHKTPIEQAFSALMVPHSGTRRPRYFRPDYSNPPQWGKNPALDRVARAVLTHFQGRLIGGGDFDKLRDGLRARMQTCLHEAAHVASYVFSGGLLCEVVIRGSSPQRVHGQINATCHNSPSMEAFESLVGYAMEEVMQTSLTYAELDRKHALATVGRDEFDAVLDVARDFVRAAKRPINFIAWWLLICSASSGKVAYTRLKAIADATRTDVRRIGEEVNVLRRLKVIDQRLEAARKARLASPRPLLPSPSPHYLRVMKTMDEICKSITIAPKRTS